MNYLSSTWLWTRKNWLLMTLAGVFSMYSWVQAKKINMAIKEMSVSRSMEHQIEDKAVYMAGSNCVIKATPDISKQLFMDLAMACARKHELYLSELGIQNDEETK